MNLPDKTATQPLNTVCTCFIHRFTAGNISGDLVVGKYSERDIGYHQTIQHVLAIRQRDRRHYLMRLPGHFAQHTRRMFGIVRFLKHFTIKDNDGICSQHWQIAGR